MTAEPQTQRGFAVADVELHEVELLQTLFCEVLEANILAGVEVLDAKLSKDFNYPLPQWLF